MIGNSVHNHPLKRRCADIVYPSKAVITSLHINTSCIISNNICRSIMIYGRKRTNDERATSNGAFQFYISNSTLGRYRLCIVMLH